MSRSSTVSRQVTAKPVPQGQMRAMTGLEHYREAERLLAEAIQAPGRHANPAAAYLLAQAQVHATLAAADAAAELAEARRPRGGVF